MVKWCRTCPLFTGVSRGPGPGPGPLRSNTALVRSRNIFWTRLGPCVAFALLFLFISYKPHFTLATKKESNWRYCYHWVNVLRRWKVRVCDIFSIKKLANGSLLQVCMEFLIPFGNFDHVQITEVPEPVPVHLWLDHTICIIYCNYYSPTGCFRAVLCVHLSLVLYMNIC